MKTCMIASLLAVGLVATAFAAEAAKFYVVKDTVGLCSVIEGSPSAGLTPIAEKGGYESRDAGDKALQEVSEKAGCQGVVEYPPYQMGRRSQPGALFVCGTVLSSTALSRGPIQLKPGTAVR